MNFESKFIEMSIIKPNEDAICNACDTKLAEEALKCKSCSQLQHFRCSELPEYHIVRLYIHRASTFTCRICVRNGERFDEANEKVRLVTESEKQSIAATAEAETQETQQENSSDVNEEVNESDGGSVTISENPNSSRNGGDHERNLGGEQDRQQPTTSNQNSSNETGTTPLNRGDHHRPIDDICKMYLQKKCPKGKSGKVNGRCPKKHPKICYRFINFGTKRDGCKEGAGCRYYHPRICYQFDKRGKCNHTDCTFYHAKKRLQGTQRRSNESSSGYRDRTNGMPIAENARDQPSYARVTASGPTIRTSIASRQFSSGTEEEPRTVQQNQYSGFLEIQTQMQEQIRQLTQMMQILVTKGPCVSNPISTRQQMCHCGNQS